MQKIIRLKLNPIPAIKEKKNDFSEIDIFDLGTLIQFETHAWQARKRLPKEIAAKMVPTQKDKASKDWVRANKNLIDTSHLAEINGIISNARQIVWDAALPFPISGIHLIANDQVTPLTDNLNGHITLLKEAVDKFVTNYEQHIKEAEKILKPYGIFNHADYPQDIGRKFSINYRFFNLTIPKHITAEMKKEETDKFKALMKETRSMGILALREGFADIVNHLVETLTGKLDGEKKRLSQKAIDKVNEFFVSFQNKNIFQDDELEKIIVQAKDLLQNLDSTEMRKDTDLTKLVNKELGKVKKELDNSIESFKRKISFD